jgi:transposase
MAIVTVGIDLAKNVFAVHGVDATGKPVLIRPSVTRARLAELIMSLPPCLIGMEACSGAHCWARRFTTSSRCIAPFWPLRATGHQHRLKQSTICNQHITHRAMQQRKSHLPL